MEHENKVIIQEVSVLGCLKKELEEEFSFAENEQRDNIANTIGFVDGGITIETETVKLEDVKEEITNVIQKNFEHSYCNVCGGNYDRYCPNCSSLSHILNNLIPNIQPELDLNTIPINMFEIRELPWRRSVFALKTLQNGLILGPFEGVTPIESTTGFQWKIKDKKFANDQNGNWMKYIQSVENRASKNLDVFQIDGILYFETSREIQEGEELLLCYREDKGQMLNSDKEEEFYLVPVKKEEYPKVFACTFCCLGFRLERCLMEHKSKCPQRNQGDKIEDFEIIQCHCCKVWFEKRELLESHMLHCLENYNRLSHNLPGFRSTNTDEDNKIRVFVEMLPLIDGDASYSTPSTNRSCGINREAHKKDHFPGDQIKNEHSNTSEEEEYKCSKCSYKTNYKSRLKTHLVTHSDIKPFECDICKKRFTQKVSLNLHLRSQHSNTSEKEYKCSQCSFQTNYKPCLRNHLDTHSDIKPFECDICKKRFTVQSTLKQHMRDHHSHTIEKKYKCSTCPYQTNRKPDLKNHLDTHNDTKPFECDICKKRFTLKRSLKLHIKDHHSNTSEKEYKCSQCSYQTNRKYDLKNHLDTHNDIKAFGCDICKKTFGRRDGLNWHIRNHHSNTSEKEYKCSECSYQTNGEEFLKLHLNTHNNIKLFECDICKKGFVRKDNLKFHIKNEHSNTSEKEYKCSECPYQANRKSYLQLHIKDHHSNTSEKEYKCSECLYQTNRKSNLKLHLNTHSDLKAFECDICKKTFTLNRSLKQHIRDHHSNTIEKEYKCSECSYQTNYRSTFQQHLNTHKDIKEFECDICKKRFALIRSLKLHVKDHHSNTSGKEYKCSECPYQTNYRSTFEQHLNTHKDIKPFECGICKKRFSHKCSLKHHMRDHHSHTSEKRYKCAECSYQTNYKSDLNKHLGTHNDIKPFECDTCQKKFTQKGHLQMHMSTQHANITE